MTTRRDFLKTMTMASAGLALGTGDLLGAPISVSQRKAAADKVKIAYVGIGNRGEQIIGDFARTGMVEVVALCDVDMGAPHTQKVMNMYPKAKRFRDFRQMFDKAGNDFDAVAIATPDHSHFPITMLALASGTALKDDPLIEVDTIGLKGSPTNVFKSFTPPQKGAGTMLTGDDVAAQLAGALAKKHLI